MLLERLCALLPLLPASWCPIGNPDPGHVDFIVIGGGTACVIHHSVNSASLTVLDALLIQGPCRCQSLVRESQDSCDCP